VDVAGATADKGAEFQHAKLGRKIALEHRALVGVVRVRGSPLRATRNDSLVGIPCTAGSTSSPEE